MKDDFDFYDLLEIDEDAPQEEVKDAFRVKVREYHPDLNEDPDAPAQFTAVKKAYEILKDPSERQAYDRLGHKDYVAKRTSGIPDPSAWRTDDHGGRAGGGRASATTNGGATGSARGSRSSQSSGAGSTTSGSSASSSASRSGSRSSRSSDGSRSSGSSASRSSRSSRRASASTATGSAGGGSGSTTSNRRATTAGSATSGSRSSGGSTDATIGTRTGRKARTWRDNRLFEWWRGLNLGWPLMLAATLLFLAGVGQWIYANVGNFRTFASAVAAAGTDTTMLQSAVVDRHGIPTLYEFVLATDLVAAPLPRLQWYGALVGVVAVPILMFGLYRVIWARRPYKWVTMNETVGIGLAAATAATLYGGPLLAGAVVMPFVFTVIIRHTRVAYKFKPTYGYVLGVSAPLAAIGAEYAVAAPPLAVDVAAAALPVLSVLVLLFSAFVRPKLFG